MRHPMTSWLYIPNLSRINKRVISTFKFDYCPLPMKRGSWSNLTISKEAQPMISLRLV